MSLQMGLEIECLLVLRNPPRSSNLGTDQSAIHQHIAEKFNAYTEGLSSGERMVVERSSQASTTAPAEAENGFKTWTVGDDISVRPDDENTTQGNPPFSKFESSWNIWQKHFIAMHFRDAFFL